MHPATLHGVGVITKLYFVIFAAFKESSDLESCSEVIQVHTFWRHPKARVLFYTLAAACCVCYDDDLSSVFFPITDQSQ